MILLRDITETVTFLSLSTVLVRVVGLWISADTDPSGIPYQWLFWHPKWVLVHFELLKSSIDGLTPFIDLADYEEIFFLWHRNPRRFTVLPSIQYLCLSRPLHPRFGTYIVFRRGRRWVAKSDCWLHVRPSGRPHWTAQLSRERFAWNLILSSSLQNLSTLFDVGRK